MIRKIIRLFQKKDRLMIIGEHEIRIKKIKKISDGIIYATDKTDYPFATSQPMIGRKYTYYVMGEFDPKTSAMMDHATSYFENRYFRAMAKDTFSSAEFVLIVIMIMAMASNLYIVYRLEQFFKVINF